MKIINIAGADDEAMRVYGSLTDRQLRLRRDSESGIFIAESPKVILRALDAGYEPLSLLCERKHIEGDASEVIGRCGEIPVYTGDREILSHITGYRLTRGVLCAMKRRPLPPLPDLVEGRNRIAVIDGVTDTTNIGSIFRSAAALGVDAVVLTPTSCDPLNRRAVRVSMGSVFLVPWTISADPWESLRRAGFSLLAMSLRDDSLSLDDERLLSLDRTAVVLGTEGDGLSDATIGEADFSVRIPMYHEVDSLNVGAAAAVAFWQLRKRRSDV